MFEGTERKAVSLEKLGDDGEVTGSNPTARRRWRRRRRTFIHFHLGAYHSASDAS